ncbi:hypothetical protein V1389_01870 [Flavobacterium rakeshii]|uniref:hypothetical protein n=1 Tax=Flavobacterium rakeshii TaxID=1038845 RepID=UPI002E7B6BEC|nr:hypothetical protein [Flavobacterium rakeshii]MEE1897064.1 hypothetical protein [Flavobacterium rakeshii]
MKNTGNTLTRKKKYAHYFSFKRKDAIIRYIEIAVITIIAIMVIGGLYGIFN